MIDIKMLYIIAIIVAFCSMLLQLYRLIREGNLIVKTQKNIIFIEAMLFIGLTIFYGISVTFNIVSYLNNEEVNSKKFLQEMIMLQCSVCMLLQARRYSGIKKNGISVQYDKETYFYKWNEIKSYKWINEDEFQFQILQKNNPTIYKTMEIGAYKQQEIDEVLQSYILKN
ncbi:DUF5673 domain-containing protein [Clostridium lundense]|uniref:DUF5673 domain-containing protein n=1 Tax=Clostridium lundense TaxID=319475 RepID=UPI000481F914|nr:DUF5673 domain-containing protein [Clostridium lundense]